jgi:hypothetical protein
MIPTVGRILHINGGNNTCWAALVTAAIDARTVHLTVFAPNMAPYMARAVVEGEGPGDWHWPEKQSLPGV